MKEKIQAIKEALKGWWKIWIILITLGLIISGFTLDLGFLKCNKQPVKIPGLVEKK